MPDIEFPVPTGERGDIPDNELPTTALRLSQNVFRDERGLLAIRPGYRPLSNAIGGRIMGIGYFRTALGAERYVVVNQIGAAHYNGTTWVDITGTLLTGGTANHVRFTVFPVSGNYKIIFCNEVNTPKIWDGAAAAYSDLLGSPGVSIDGVVVNSRLCLLQAPNKIKISEFNNPEIFPPGNGFNVYLPDAGDLMKAIGRLDRTSCGVLGEESQWVGRAQSGQNPMRFDKISDEPGPMSSACLIRWGRALYYLADDYNVYRFDGVATTAVGWPMKSWVQSTINTGNKRMAHGEYFDKVGKMYWLFPQGNLSAPNAGIYFDPRTGEMGRLLFGQRFITSMGRVRVIVSVTWDDLEAAGITWNTIDSFYPSWDSLGDDSTERRTAFGSSDGGIFIGGVGDGSDGGTPIEALFEVPLKTYAGWPRSIVPETFETFFQKTVNPTMVELSVGYTDTLMGDLEYQLIDTFDLSKNQRNDIDLMVDSLRERRFITVRQKISAPTGQVAWQGGILTCQGAQIPKGPTSSDA